MITGSDQRNASDLISWSGRETGRGSTRSVIVGTDRLHGAEGAMTRAGRTEPESEGA